MSREWKPGDVALVTWQRTGTGGSDLAFKDDKGWETLDGWLANGDVIDARPLVVIDPESREDVERLEQALEDAGLDIKHGDYAGSAAWTKTEKAQAALRNIANPTPPKPEEPTGLGAVVRDGDNEAWTRHRHGDWVCLHSPGHTNDVHKWDALVERYGPLTTVWEGVES